MSRSVIIRAGGDEEVIPSKLVTELRKNDRVVVETAGGGGYGKPSSRPSEQVLADLRDGKISAETAKKIYGLKQSDISS